MTDCENAEIRDLLPDYAHGTLSAEALRRVETHIADCGLCSEEWALLRRLGVALSAQPPVNVAAIVAALPPSPAVRPRMVLTAPHIVQRRPVLRQPWLRIAASLLFIVGASSVFIARSNRVAVEPSAVVTAPALSPTRGMVARVESVKSPMSRPAPELATSIATDLSDKELRGLLDEIDALSAEPSENSEEVVRGLPGSTRAGDL